MKAKKTSSTSKHPTRAATIVDGDDNRQTHTDSTLVAGSSNPDVDTVRQKALLESGMVITSEERTSNVASHFDPYNNAGLKPTNRKPRKSLDDLRILSEEIKKSRQSPQKPLLRK